MTEIYRPDLSTAGYSVVEGYVLANYPQVHYLVSEGIDEYIGGVVPTYGEKLQDLARNIIKGYDNVKADHPKAVEVALNTVAASQFIVAAALPHPPEMMISMTLERHIINNGQSENLYQSLNREMLQAMSSSHCFKGLLKEFSPSIDQDDSEPEIISLFGGFALLTLGEGETARLKKIKEDIEAEADILMCEDGDLMGFFDS